MPPHAVAELQAVAGVIRNHVNDAIGRLKPDECPGAINWGDLSCVEVSLVLTDDEPQWRVVIEEASPDAWNLQIYVHKELVKLGYDAFVSTEW